MTDGARWIAADSGLAALFGALEDAGYAIFGPLEQDGTIGLGPISGPDELPLDKVMDSQAGQVRCRTNASGRYFDKSLAMQALKPLVYPEREELFRMDSSFEISVQPAESKKIAVIGVRACDLAAIDVLETVLCRGPYPDDQVRSRRANLLLIAVDCAVPLETCFCASMQTGPHARGGFDLALTELSGDQVHGFILRSGSEAGARLFQYLPTEAAGGDRMLSKQIQAEAAAAAMTRQMPANAQSVVTQSHDTAQWGDVAARCLMCANCTMVCPTCFCSSVDDRNDLDGTAWRERRWDSCFSLQFSHLHGGAVRTSPKSRYRQWITHKLGHWHDQFAVSGCVGCGRCIAWCPVGIDITKEVAALAERFPDHGPNDIPDPAKGAI